MFNTIPAVIVSNDAKYLNAVRVENVLLIIAKQRLRKCNLKFFVVRRTL